MMLYVITVTVKHQDDECSWVKRWVWFKTINYLIYNIRFTYYVYLLRNL